jgi:hypothetical protein
LGYCFLDLDRVLLCQNLKFNKTVTIMKTNMGTLDRIIRVAVALIILALYYTGVITGTLGLVLLVFAVVFALTSLVSFCPLYPLLGINTKAKE